MQQSMDQASVPIAAIFDPIVGRVMVIVIEESRRCEKFRRRIRQVELAGEL
jgi:hypothetical protein